MKNLVNPVIKTFHKKEKKWVSRCGHDTSVLEQFPYGRKAHGLVPQTALGNVRALCVSLSPATKLAPTTDRSLMRYE